MAERPNVYEIITDQMLETLKRGVVPWQKPWTASEGAPRNFVTKKPYRGINTFILLSSGYDCPFWATYKAFEKKGGQVRKGEKSTMVIFWKFNKYEELVNGQKVEKTIPLLRYYRVFNALQVDGITIPETPALPDHVENVSAEDIMNGYLNTVNGPTFDENAVDQAFYVPGTDHISVPSRKSFPNPEGFYSTVFHEMTHSTGHKSRKDRFTGTNESFGSHDYGREELVAEMGAAFLSAEAGITTTFNNSAAYLQSWMDVIKADPKAVVWAGGKAQAAVDLILNRKAEAAEEE